MLIAVKIIVTGLLLCLSCSLALADLQDSREQLKQIQQRIDRTQSDLRAKQQSEVQYSRELALLNRTLKQINNEISALNREQETLQQQIDEQNSQLGTLKKQIRKAGKRMEKRLVALYKEGDVGTLKILFSADSPTELVQQYHYLTRVAEHDQELLDDYRKKIIAQQQHLDELKRLEKEKSALLNKVQRQHEAAADGRQLQSRLLKQVRSEKTQLKKELVGLKERAERLQNLIGRLQRETPTPAPASVPSTSAVSFSSGKGKLGWPVEGKVLIAFGTQKDATLGTYYESNGVEISAVPGSDIHAVADGRVVFSAWFKGYGNLMIVNHIGGFHTLYAQADKLDKSIGELVRAGEVLGKSGLDGRDSIYFEIRMNGTPVDPLRWLRRR